MSFSLGARSLSRLQGVHPDLVKVVQRAIQLTPVDFTVLEGLRTLEQQKKYLAEGKSLTLKSRHLDGHAVDLAPFVSGAVSWEWQYFHQIAAAMKRAATELEIPLEWGGDWIGLKDGPHFQLPWKQYPEVKKV